MFQMTKSNWLRIAVRPLIKVWTFGVAVFLLGGTLEANPASQPAKKLIEKFKEETSIIKKQETKPQDPARQKQAKQKQTRQKQTRQEQAKQEQAKQEQAKQEQAKQEQAKQEQAKQEQAKQEQAKQEQAKQEQAWVESVLKPYFYFLVFLILGGLVISGVVPLFFLKSVRKKINNQIIDEIMTLQKNINELRTQLEELESREAYFQEKKNESNYPQKVQLQPEFEKTFQENVRKEFLAMSQDWLTSESFEQVFQNHRNLIIEIIREEQEREQVSRLTHSPETTLPEIKNEQSNRNGRFDFLKSILVSDLLNQFSRERKYNFKDGDGFVEHSEGNFIFIPQQGENQGCFTVIPTKTWLKTAQDFDVYLKHLFDCQDPKNGPLRVMSPALVQLDGSIIQRGELSVD